MTDPPSAPDSDPTQRTCPACGDTFTDPSCDVCGGKGMVTPEEWEAWRKARVKTARALVIREHAELFRRLAKKDN